MSKALPSYTLYEEWANSLTHGLGALMAVVGTVALIFAVIPLQSLISTASVSLYGASLIFMFLASTLYHSVQDEAARRFFREVDHMAILYLIAGTYTPFTLISLNGGWGWTIFSIVWALTGIGTLLQFTTAKRIKALMVSLYLVMGWVIVIAIKPLIDQLAIGGLVLLVMGGLAYSVGVVFYVNKRIPFNHAIWHLFVLAGAACHFFAIYYFVLS